MEPQRGLRTGPEADPVSSADQRPLCSPDITCLLLYLTSFMFEGKEKKIYSHKSQIIETLDEYSAN